MNVPFFFALRYLFARKSHNVINIISAISAAGMAVGTAALIIILSVYNGFDDLVRSSMSTVDPDLKVVPAQGKTFVPSARQADWDAVRSLEGVAACFEVLEESVFVSYDERQASALAKGVDSLYERQGTEIFGAYLRSGRFRLHRGDVPEAVVGVGLAWNLGLNPHFVTPLELYYPSRTKPVSLANPAASLGRTKVWPSGTFSINSDVDAATVFVPLETLRELLEYEEEVSAVEIRLLPDADAEAVHKRVEECLGPEFTVKNRYQQNEGLYKMMEYEKIVIWLILVFVIVIIAFNIFGSLSMLMIEKREDILTMQFLGMPLEKVRHVFVLEGWLISLLGLLIGLVVGLGFCYLQQRTGLIQMPGNFMVDAYPVVIRPWDVVVTALSVALIGWVIALVPARRIHQGE
ncbi:MAG: ABC transporter permease [Bacteroidales bacterium]|nr:ABC transporter permease [Bacteroidales bacterium]